MITFTYCDNKNIYEYKSMSVNEFLKHNDMYNIDMLKLGTNYTPQTVHINECDEIPYLLVTYIETNLVGVIGCKIDTLMSIIELVHHNIISLNHYDTFKNHFNNTPCIVWYDEFSAYEIQFITENETVVISQLPTWLTYIKKYVNGTLVNESEIDLLYYDNSLSYDKIFSESWCKL